MNISFNTLDAYIKALYSISPNISRDDWIKTIFASKSAGIPFEIWNQWSSGGNTYNEREAFYSWSSAKESGGITAATLFYMAQGGSEFNQQFKNNNKNEYKKSKKIALNEVARLFNSYLTPESNHSYIQAKSGWADGLKMVPLDNKETIRGICIAGALVVPCYEGDKLKTLQYITSTEKLNLPNATFDDGYFIHGATFDKIYIVEGLGQSWAAIEASGCASAITFGFGRTKRVIQAVKRQYPNSEIFICPDVGKLSDAEKIASEFGLNVIKMPEGWPQNSDINDLMQKEGLPALRNIFLNPITNKSQKELAFERINSQKKAMQDNSQSSIASTVMTRHIECIAHAGHHTFLYGSAGSFKTTFTSALCLNALKANQKLEIHYWGFDVSPPYSKAILEDLKQERFSLFCNQSIQDLKDFYLEYLNNDIRLDDVVIVIDTFKYLTKDVNNKHANKEALHFIKSICRQGAAWISLGHSNKDGVRESGTAEIEQDSDAVLRIDSIIQNQKGIANIKKAGRCRWGDIDLTIETVISADDKDNPHHFWANAIRNAKIVNDANCKQLIALNDKIKEIELIAGIINSYNKTNNHPINKTTLSQLIKNNEVFRISVREVDSILEGGKEIYWKVTYGKNYNERLFSPINVD